MTPHYKYHYNLFFPNFPKHVVHIEEYIKSEYFII